MTNRDTQSTVRGIMAGFAARTGLSSDRTPRRYLWTDAFAVCNYLGLYAGAGDDTFRDLALRLVDQVHAILGRHRPDDPRTGWLSGLSGQEAEEHPTAGGLRIGKPLPERRPGERLEEQLEWDRDGQYFHYLTKWMHALNRASRVTGDLVFHRWAVEMARRVHDAFTHGTRGAGSPRMVWKMSIDLSRPLVSSMGHHDPLDAYLTYHELQATGGGTQDGRELAAEIADAEGMMRGRSWPTDDPLGIGNLLSDAYRGAQLVNTEHFDRPDLVAILLESALSGLRHYVRTNPLTLPAAYRLGFRELGLAIGLHALERIRAWLDATPRELEAKGAIHGQLRALSEYGPLAEEIEAFWLDPAHQAASTWTEHIDINDVMLATSLAPDGYLRL